MNITLRDNQTLSVNFRYDPALVALVKSMPARRYEPKNKAWLLPLAGVHESVEQLLKYGFAMTPDAADAIRAQERVETALRVLSEASDTSFSTSLPLFAYQRVGARFLHTLGSGLLADEVGLGKTLMALAVLDRAKAERVLILCPAILKYQMENEIQKFLPGWKVSVIDGSQQEREQAWQEPVRVYVANYELLLRDKQPQEHEWDYVICDEATRISNPRTKTYRTLQKIRARHRLALTGTPVSNRPDDLWGILNWTHPGILGSYESFLDRYTIRNQWGGIYKYQELDALAKRIKPYYIRRLKQNVLAELPDKIYTDIPFKLNDKEDALYKKLQKELLHEIDEMDISKVNEPTTIQHTLVKMMRLRQLTDSMELLGESKESTKLEVLKELLTDILG